MLRNKNRIERAHFINDLKIGGKLDASERERLAAYEFDKGPVTIWEQIDRYGLIVKRDRGPQRHDEFLRTIKQTGINLKKSLFTQQEIAALAKALHDYVSGFSLHANQGTPQYTVVYWKTSRGGLQYSTIPAGMSRQPAPSRP
ncbi:MAG: hypothetical protein H6865_06805 [Rhodospirillales bacterium]|nr:hypothetical protein [Alphaproteobacteria bacterium]MCB9987326.1 hypothetical protein [Rhodospirillales bacterium]USO07819.1 MAG: hypothetical protein H6866_00895 [Rhodospirillales bacterium]